MKPPDAVQGQKELVSLAGRQRSKVGQCAVCMELRVGSIRGLTIQHGGTGCGLANGLHSGRLLQRWGVGVPLRMKEGAGGVNASCFGWFSLLAFAWCCSQFLRSLLAGNHRIVAILES